MDFSTTEEQRLLCSEMIRFAQAELNDGAAERDRSQSFSRELWQKCAEMGLQGLPVEDKYGGVGADSLTTALVLEAFGYGCHDGGLVFAIGAHLLACVIPVWKNGGDELKSKYLPGMCDGSLVAVNGMTEPQSGSDAFSMLTTAVPDGDGFRLNGVKIFSSNGPVADVALVYAITDKEKGYYGGVTGFLIETDTPGFSTGQKFEKMGLRSCPIGELVMDDCYVPASAVVGVVGSGSEMFNESMEWERICLVACHVGKMQWLLEKAVEYAKTRGTSRQKISKYQAVSHRIANMKIRLEAARLLTYRAASEIGKSRENAMHASIAKTFASDSLVETALDTVKVFGGYGIMSEYDVERALRDSVASTLYSGTNDIQRNIIAGWLGL